MRETTVPALPRYQRIQSVLPAVAARLLTAIRDAFAGLPNVAVGPQIRSHVSSSSFYTTPDFMRCNPILPFYVYFSPNAYNDAVQPGAHEII